MREDSRRTIQQKDRRWTERLSKRRNGRTGNGYKDYPRGGLQIDR
jgi:hypothetical protein